MEGPVGFEPTTPGLKVRSSTAELRAQTETILAQSASAPLDLTTVLTTTRFQSGIFSLFAWQWISREKCAEVSQPRGLRGRPRPDASRFH
jgi:hypothetical protein